MGKYKTITLGVKRDIRLARFNISQCSAQLTYELEPGDDLEKAYKEVHEDAIVIVEEMIAEEKRKFKELVKGE